MVLEKKSVHKTERATENLHIRVSKTDLAVIRSRIRSIRVFLSDLERRGVVASQGHTVGKVVCDALDLYSLNLKSRLDILAGDSALLSASDKDASHR